jgi:hypothetical protein
MRLFASVKSFFRVLIWRRSSSDQQGGRFVFRFWDGSQFRLADPLVLTKRLEKDKSINWKDLIRSILENPLASDGSKDSNDKVSQLICLIREAFQIQSLEQTTDGKPTGLTDLGCVQLLGQFMNWVIQYQQAFIVNIAPIIKVEEKPESNQSLPKGLLRNKCYNFDAEGITVWHEEIGSC